MTNSQLSTVVESFLAHVEHAGKHWLWRGPVTAKGFPRQRSGATYVSPHRVLYEQHTGQLLGGHVLRRTCGNQLCVFAPSRHRRHPQPHAPGQRRRAVGIKLPLRSEGRIQARRHRPLARPDSTRRPHRHHRRVQHHQRSSGGGTKRPTTVERGVNDLYEALLGALQGVPALPNAKCRGNPQLWESDDPADVAAAERTCRQFCAELQKCETHWRSLKPSQRPTACTIAGQWRPPHRPRIRTRTHTLTHGDKTP
jgi:hypothetical protein